MPIVLIFIVMITLLIVGVGLKSGFTQPTAAKQVTSERIKRSSRAQINTMLAQLETKSAPEEPMGAMCYAPLVSQVEAIFVCPIDGQKTVYRGEDNLNMYEYVLEAQNFSRSLERLNALTTKATFGLDEKLLCNKCSPGLTKEKRLAALVATYPDGHKKRFEYLARDDMRLISRFIASRRDASTPKLSTEELQRVKAILGVELDGKVSK